jgi:aryl-alcohol dehydrogenase-like predicted oxidoreductase
MHRKLGTRGPEVSSLGFGCMGLNYGYGPGLGKQEAISLIREAFARGGLWSVHQRRMGG